MSRNAVLALVGLSMIVLVPGLLLPVLTIRGVLTKDGVAQVAPAMLERGLNDETVDQLKKMMNPQTVAMIEAFGGGLKKTIIDRLGPQLAKAIQQGDDVEVYTQTRSILGSVRELYRVGSPVPATLILLFSVIVPFGKAGLVAWSVFMKEHAAKVRTVRFVETIAKWSMADVFVVALFIAFLAAQATQTTPGSANPALVSFDAHFGPGFYWFATYCLFSLASQQWVSKRTLQDSLRS